MIHRLHVKLARGVFHQSTEMFGQTSPLGLGFKIEEINDDETTEVKGLHHTCDFGSSACKPTRVYCAELARQGNTFDQGVSQAFTQGFALL